MIMNDEWKHVVGYEGRYKVSSSGIIISIQRTVSNGPTTSRVVDGCTLSQQNNGKGYYTVNLSKNGRAKKEYVHRIVAKAFLDNPNSYKEVNHKDENKQNNSVSNLEWCTSSYNKRYGSFIERIITSRNKSKKGGYEKPVYKYDRNGSLLDEYKSIADASRKTGISEENIRSAIKGKSKSAHGFQWSRTKHNKIHPYKNEKMVKVTLCTADGKYIKTYNSASAAAKDTDCDISKIVACCRGNRKSTRGLYFRYFGI